MDCKTAMMAAAIISLGIADAHADSVTGTIEDLNPTSGSFRVGDQTFKAAPNNTVGPTLDELQDGDEVEVYYVDDSGDETANVMTISKIEDAGRSDEATGAVEMLDADERTFVVDGRTFTVAEEGVSGVSLDHLQEGDEVVVVYVRESAEDPIEPLALYKMN